MNERPFFEHKALDTLPVFCEIRGFDTPVEEFFDGVKVSAGCGIEGPVFEDAFEKHRTALQLTLTKCLDGLVFLLVKSVV